MKFSSPQKFVNTSLAWIGLAVMVLFLFTPALYSPISVAAAMETQTPPATVTINQNQQGRVLQ